MKYDHINEQGTIAWAKTMAQRLKEMTETDPLTIDQTVMIAYGKSSLIRQADNVALRKIPEDGAVR